MTAVINGNMEHNLARFLVEFAFRVYYLFSLIIRIFIVIVVYAWTIMTERKQGKKRKLNEGTQTVCNRSAINANWQALLSTKMLSGDTPPPAKPTDRYTGEFRRTRKKKKEQQKIDNSLPNVDTLNIEMSKENKDAVKKEGPPRHGDAPKLTKVVAMDCEMVGVGADGADSMIARVSIVNRFGDCVYDKFVKPREEVTDYRTEISGIRRENLLNGEEFTVVQKEVAEILRNRTLVGHGISHDLDVLFLSHPKRSIRDTSKYKPYRKLRNGQTPSLKFLASTLLAVDIQQGEHSSVEDARAVLQLYLRTASDWERALASRKNK